MRAFTLPLDPSVLVGLAPADDAAVVRLTEDLALVFTTDFFAPLVDDPRTFGRIAAANALSDVYAMGGRPLVALNLVCFPTKTLGMEVLGAVLEGGAEVARAAGISIAGGHSVEDPEPKYGLAVVGTVHPERVWRKGGAKPGDVLVLTKALGSGVLATALKRGKIAEAGEDFQAAVRSMTTLNAGAAEALYALGVRVHAATDVTGYGLVGHLGEMLRASEGVAAVLDASALPTLSGAEALVREGVLAGGTKANRAFVAPWMEVAPGVDDARVWVSCDAQTSGGLLVACPEDDAERFVTRLRETNAAPCPTVIGRVIESERPTVTLR